MRLRSALTTRLNVLILVLSLTVAELPLAPSLPLLTGAGVLVLPHDACAQGSRATRMRLFPAQSATPSSAIRRRLKVSSSVIV